MGTQLRTTVRSVAFFASYVAVSFAAYVYLGLATGLFFGAMTVVNAACPKALITGQVKQQLKEGMMSVSTVVIMGYVLAYGYCIIIAVYATAATLNAHFGI